MVRPRIGTSNFRLATLWSCLNRGWKRQMNGRDLQIALRRETKSLLPLVASLLARRPFVLRWIMAAGITLVLAEASLGASNSASSSVGTPDLATDATEVQVLGVRSSTQADHSLVAIDLSA